MLEVIYEDNDVVAFNKPAGVLFDWALMERPELIPAHRLDRDTSGVTLYAKNQKTTDYLKNLFQTHQIQKVYHALVMGHLKDKNGTINLSIGRSRKDPRRRVATPDKKGTLREAITHYRTLKVFDDYTLVEARPKTGRTHQIRTHFAAIGHPIVCDPLYAGKRLVCPGNLQRHFLHAKGIEFDLPSAGPDHNVGGTHVRLEADLSTDLEETLNVVDTHKPLP